MSQVYKAVRDCVAKFQAFFNFDRHKRGKPRIEPSLRISRSALNLFIIGALSLNLVSTAVPALIASYNDAQARIPHALGSISQTSGLPATDTLPAGGRVSKLPDSTNAQLASDLAAVRKGKQDLRH